MLPYFLELVYIGFDPIANQMRDVAIFGDCAIPIIFHFNPRHRNIETLPNGDTLCYAQLSRIYKGPHKCSDPSPVTYYQNLVWRVSGRKG